MRAKRIIFLDGEFLVKDERFVQSLAPGLFKARGVFETVRADDGKIFALSEHLGRMKQGLKTLGLRLPYALPEVKKFILETIKRNRFSRARVRVVVWQARPPIGQRRGQQGTFVRMAITSLPYQPPPQIKYRRGYCAAVIKTNRRAGKRYASVKSLDYQIFANAYERAKRRGYDEALLLNQKGCVFEASRSNIFLVKNGGLYTPSLLSGCLNGITRQKILKLARQMNVAVHQKNISFKEIMTAQEAFLTNSLIGVMPLTSVGGKKVGNGFVGTLTSQIIRQYRQVISKS